MFEISVGDGGVILLRGRFDASQREKAEPVFDGIEGEAVVDLSGLEYIASDGLRVILRTFKRLHEKNQKLKLINPSRRVYNVFHYAGLTALMDIEAPS